MISLGSGESDSITLSQLTSLEDDEEEDDEEDEEEDEEDDD
jgi:hypothetical protein